MIKNKKNINYILAFIIPFCVLLFGFNLCLHGGKSILYGDLQGQYVPLFSYLKNVLSGNATFAYTFTKGLGGSMISTYAYYLMSPLNMIIKFVPYNLIPLGLLGIIILKLSLAGLTSYIYLSNHLKTNSKKLLVLSTCYAVSAYSVNYSFCLMWIDALYMLPLIFLGLKRIINGKSSLMYILCLFYTIYCNYYIAYMVCIFIVIYFIYEVYMDDIYKNKKELLSVFIRVLLSSLIACFLTMFIMIPMLKDLSQSARAVGNYAGNFNLSNVSNNFDFINIIKQLLIGYSIHDTFNMSTFDIYMGIVNIPLIYFYFINNKIDIKEKKFTLFVLVLLISSYSIKYLNYIWHGFAFPNGLNYRFTFLFIFYFTIVLSKSLLNINSIKKINYYIFALVYVLIMNMIININFREIYINVYLSTSLIIIYLTLLYNLSNSKIDIKQKKDLKIFVILLVCLELSLNIYLCLNKNYFFSNKEFNDYINIYSKEINKLRKKDTSFYRMNQNDIFNLIHGLLLNYNGIQSFLSTNSKKTMKFMKINGYFANEISIVNSTDNFIVPDSLIGLKYYYTYDDCKAGYEPIDTYTFSTSFGLMYEYFFTDFNVCKNNNAMGLGYLIDNDWNTYADNLNNFSYSLVNSSILNSMVEEKYSILNEYDNVEKINYIEYKFKANDSDYIYITYMAKSLGELHVYINGNEVYYGDFPNNIVLIENKYKGEEITIKFKAEIIHDLGNVKVYDFNYEEFEKAINELKKHELELEVFSDTYIKGKINVVDGKNVLFTSIPNDLGWTAYVDGKETPITELYEAFVGLELENGEHVVEFKYHIPGLKLGCIISGITFIIMCVYLKLEKKLVK